MLLTAALGLLAGMALAAPAPAAMNTPVSSQDLALLGAGALALLSEKIPSREGAKQYGFAATLAQYCGVTNASTTLTLGPVIDSKYHVVENWRDVSQSGPWPDQLDVLGTKLSIEVNQDSVSYQYGALRWNSSQPFQAGDDFSCLARDWSSDRPCSKSSPSYRSRDILCILWIELDKYGKIKHGNTNASVGSAAPSIETRTAEHKPTQVPSYPSDYLHPGPVIPSTIPKVICGHPRHQI